MNELHVDQTFIGSNLERKKQGDSNLIVRYCRKQYACFMLVCFLMLFTLEVVRLLLEKNYDKYFFKLLQKVINKTQDSNSTDFNLLSTLL